MYQSFDHWPDFITETQIVETITAGRCRTDPLPKPPLEDPREGMDTEAQKYFVAPGECLIITLVQFPSPEPILEVEYPSGYEEDHSYFFLEQLLRNFGVRDLDRLHIITSVISSFRRVLWYPNEDDLRLRIDLDNEIYYVGQETKEDCEERVKHEPLLPGSG